MGDNASFEEGPKGFAERNSNAGNSARKAKLTRLARAMQAKLDAEFYAIVQHEFTIDEAADIYRMINLYES